MAKFIVPTPYTIYESGPTCRNIPADSTPPPDPRGWPSPVFTEEHLGRTFAWLAFQDRDGTVRSILVIGETCGHLDRADPTAGEAMEVVPVIGRDRQNLLAHLRHYQGMTFAASSPTIEWLEG